jgi:N-acetylmuramoyl-L-alanine amidase
MRKTTKILSLSVAMVFMFTACGIFTGNDDVVEKAAVSKSIRTSFPVSETGSVNDKMTEEPSAEIELIALLTMAEAEAECEYGKRLVIDVVLNRVDSEHFPNAIYDVIHQPNQFSPMWNGRIDRCEVRDEISRLVMEELETRTNYEVVFFDSGGYSRYGVPMFKVENHYFSSYD